MEIQGIKGGSDGGVRLGTGDDDILQRRVLSICEVTVFGTLA